MSKATRRAVLSAIVGGLIVSPFVLRSYRSRMNGFSVEQQSEISSYFTNPIFFNMPDVSILEKDFEAEITLSSLFLRGVGTFGLRYAIELEQETLLTLGENVIRDQNGKSMVHKQKIEKELEYVIPHSSEKKEIVLKHRSNIGGQASAQRTVKAFDSQLSVALDGRMRNTMGPAVFPIETSGRYLTTPVKVGAVWNQDISVDPELNPGGNVKANYEILSAYEKEGERYFRIKREFAYKSFQAAVDSQTGKASLESQSNGVMNSRLAECCDFNLEKGYSSYEQSKSVVYIDRTGLNGILVLSETTATLISVT